PLFFFSNNRASPAIYTLSLHDALPIYEIHVQGQLDARWADWVDDLAFTHGADGTTTLAGPLADQPALHGVLNRMRDLGVSIISVNRKSTRLNSSHVKISYAVFCLKKKK